jgi:hypothetical protein
VQSETAYALVQDASQQVIMASAVPNWKQLMEFPTNFGLASTESLLFAHMKIQLTRTFEITEKTFLIALGV